MKNSLVFLFLLMLPAACHNPDRSEGSAPTTQHLPPLTAKQLQVQLETAYNTKNNDSLDKFFSYWHASIGATDAKWINLNDTIKAVYEVFKCFYQPLDLLRIGQWEWGNRLNENAKYVVVQNSIYYRVLPSENADEDNGERHNTDSIIDFHPPVDLDPGKVLYLTNGYEEALNYFLGTESSKLGEGNIMNPSQAVGESEKRYEFLRPFIPILHGHWGGYWHLATHPDVGIITLNKTLNEATINFRVGYQGGSARLSKTGNHWEVQKSNATWIE